MKQNRINQTDVLVGIDTGDIWECPLCHRCYHLIHREVRRQHKTVKVLKHDFDEIMGESTRNELSTMKGEKDEKHRK